MTKKDYILIAQAIRLEYQISNLHDRQVILDVANRIRYALMMDNDRFDSRRFMKAITDTQE